GCEPLDHRSIHRRLAPISAPNPQSCEIPARGEPILRSRCWASPRDDDSFGRSPYVSGFATSVRPCGPLPQPALGSVRNCDPAAPPTVRPCAPLRTRARDPGQSCASRLARSPPLCGRFHAAFPDPCWRSREGSCGLGSFVPEPFSVLSCLPNRALIGGAE